MRCSLSMCTSQCCWYQIHSVKGDRQNSGVKTANKDVKLAKDNIKDACCDVGSAQVQITSLGVLPILQFHKCLLIFSQILAQVHL